MAWTTDTDLASWEPGITNFLPSVQSDFSLQHEEAKRIIIDDLIQELVIKEEADILQTTELKSLSIFKTLEIIFNFLSVKEGDKYDQRSQKYLKKYNDEFVQRLEALTVDLDDDGVEDDDETLGGHDTVLVRY